MCSGLRRQIVATSAYRALDSPLHHVLRLALQTTTRPLPFVPSQYQTPSVSVHYFLLCSLLTACLLTNCSSAKLPLCILLPLLLLRLTIFNKVRFEVPSNCSSLLSVRSQFHCRSVYLLRVDVCVHCFIRCGLLFLDILSFGLFAFVAFFSSLL